MEEITRIIERLVSRVEDLEQEVRNLNSQLDTLRDIIYTHDHRGQINR